MQTTGIHRAKSWQIALFALNNTSTNLWLFFMNFIAYYMTGYVGVGVVLASSIIMGMRIWDAVTDPIIGYFVDKTDGQFGKNRPFMIVGNLILTLTTFLLVFTTHKLPEAARLPYFIAIYALYIIGYTFQTVVTKSAQTALTNDPEQRPTFGIYDGIYNTIMFASLPVLVSNVLVPKHGGFTVEMFQEYWFYIAPTAFLFTWLAVLGIASKDRHEYFGTGKPVKVTFKDYWEVLKNNRGIQMLVFAASTDKIAMQIKSNATVLVILYAIVAGNYGLQGAVAGYTTIPTILLMILGVRFVATRMGQKKALLLGSWGGILTNAALFALFYLADPKTLSFPGMEGFNGLTFFTIAFLFLWILESGFRSLAGTMVIPMTADCADYEVYRSGRYVPGLMGTLFSSVDKIVSSFATTIVGVLCSTIGFTEQLPTVDTPFSPELKFIGLFLVFGMMVLGNICNIIAMKFYPLTKEKMVDIQGEIARIKSEQVD
ncbi:MFS transporter [Streptococcus ovuberis]|uniref:Glucuronide permease n=1 Tax=Streptococcus ovuberis TaxID=1936207 RepID=A0A7X6S0S5_9STRE|nr:MFS transporter [Streptococcus ovuberis]NKZ19441.1 glucuronide permease [Streptococcus ovuberis]